MNVLKGACLFTFFVFCTTLIAQNDEVEIRAYTNDLLAKLEISPDEGEYKEYKIEDNNKMLVVAVNTTKGNYCFNKHEEFLILDRKCPYAALMKNAKRQFEFYCLEPGKFFVLEIADKKKGCALMKDFKDPIFKDFLLEPDLSKKNVNKEDIFDINTKKQFKPNTIIEVTNYSDGMAAFKKNKWGYVDRLGNIVVEARYQYARPFSQGLGAVQLDNDLWGYMNTEGKFEHHAKYNDALSYTDGYAAVKNNKGKYGYINLKGRLKIKFNYDEAKPFSEGLAPVRINKKWGYIDTTGKVVIKAKYEFAEPFKNGLAIASPDWLFGYINKEGDYFIKPHYLEVKEFNEGKAAVMPDPSRTKHLKGKKRWGFIDKSGNKVIEYKFEEAHSFSHGLAGVSLDQRWGYIDANGNYTISPKFDFVSPFKNNAALVIHNGQWRYISLDGDFLFEE